ncbi:amidohydrolase [Frankia sp. R43]|uniref:amidohydrolase family protein n=1 Tax=Frankia sp. R43 TaxID=269536 RepID=UPI0006CA34D2|nr:amidohydrolase family protein [Frankia sp. R43]KPM56204.1 amidohydrolase [Frankia sp. R43]
MEKEDMILVSIDDHSIEPPDMYERHVPARYRDLAPKVIRNDAGIDQWVFQGVATSTPFGMAATVGWPAEEWGRDPGTYTELRPGCFDLGARVDDMNANGVLASMCFPSMAGYNARTFAEAPDKKLSMIMLQAYNDWHIDEWCAGAPGRFIPIGMLPMWDAELAAAEVRRLAAKGCRAVSFLEAPHAQGYPSLLSGYWDPMLRAVVDAGTVLCLHIGGGMGLLKLPPEAPPDHSIILSTQIMTLVAQDLLFGHVLERYPTLKIAFSEAGIGWIPFYLERVDRHVRNQVWLHNDFGGRLPSEIFREHVLGCFITDLSGLKARHDIGIDIIAWESDYPHTDTTWPESPELLWGELTEAGVTELETHKITWQNACRFFEFDPFTTIPREQATVGALRARARAANIDTTRMPKDEWRRRNEAAGIGVLAR